ncbi:hypothetical protein FE810_09355 [Thalassotalea litorea]|uniref:Uncharacterized protein n=1 Tax=Thalassotalea litorea TaxID=2020715 RepID=A0A5R9IKY1_9GAMM|nr:hypothetical protein [Thalassotalea litorea]TLU65123.1 hypothetical protein FE810_09355 [Thalassotalea litorea]
MFKKITAVSASILCAALLMVNTASAEDGKRYEDSVKWKNVVKITYKIGKRDDALKIIKDYYQVASKKAKTPMPEMVMEMHTGDYDLLVIWHMQNGIEDMTWETNPDSVAWRKALNDVAGSEEKAQEILDEYVSYIAHAENEIALVR